MSTPTIVSPIGRPLFLEPTDDVELAPVTFEAQEQGDILRSVKRVHPSTGALSAVVSAEAAAARAAQDLEEAAARHKAKTASLAKARTNCGLAGTGLEPKTTPAPEAPGPKPPTYVNLTGRVLRRNRLSELTKTGGALTLASGEVVGWTASASYVDALEDLFNGAPIVVKGFATGGKPFTIMSVRPATVAEWTAVASPEDVGAWSPRWAHIRQEVVSEQALEKKRLADEHGASCQLCGREFPKLQQAALLRGGDNSLTLVCRPCKEAARRGEAVIPTPVTRPGHVIEAGLQLAQALTEFNEGRNTGEAAGRLTLTLDDGTVINTYADVYLARQLTRAVRTAIWNAQITAGGAA